MFGRSALIVLVLAPLAACAADDREKELAGVAVDMAATPASFAEWKAQCADAGEGREAWTAPAPPYRVHGNTFNVGTCGISALLVATPEGHVLIDSGMIGVAPQVAANIEQLGFRLGDVKWLLSSHEHLDHVGATAELKRMTGASSAALRVARQPLESGTPYPEDPQASFIPPFDGFPVDRVLEDGEVFNFGHIAFTPHSTPAHTPGSTSWTWQSCENGACLTLAYVDSLTTPSADDYRFTDHPDQIERIRAGFAAAGGISCGLLVTPHPAVSNMVARFSGEAPLADPSACATYARTATENFERRLAGETKTHSK